jgi:hypothetical protein
MNKEEIKFLANRCKSMLPRLEGNVEVINAILNDLRNIEGLADGEDDAASLVFGASVKALCPGKLYRLEVSHVADGDGDTGVNLEFGKGSLYLEPGNYYRLWIGEVEE